jgi:hypothetical protein
VLSHHASSRRPCHPYAVARTLFQCVCTRHRNCIGQLSPFSEYAPGTAEFPARKSATIKPTTTYGPPRSDRMSIAGPGCVKTLTFNLRVEYPFLDFVHVEIKCTGNFCRKKAIEKAILCILGPTAFSHGLGHELTRSGVRSESV